MDIALLKVKTDVIRALENQEVTIPVLLDLSAAFNTINHDTLLSRGPILFTLYMVPLGFICRSNEHELHLYTDDTQIYITFKPGEPNFKSDCMPG